LKILSILIPTFNRGDKLSVLLSHLLPLDSLLSAGLLEIVISNNASTDHTHKLVEEYQELLPIRYYKQSSNLGFDANVIFLYDVQEGAWSMLVGDDDLLSINLLGDILSILRTSDQSTIYLLPSKSIFKNERSESWPKLNIPDSILPYPMGLFMILRRGLSRFGFIGCHIFPASLTKNYLTILQNPEFKYWTHLFYFLNALKQRFTLRYIKIPLVTQRLGDTDHRYHYSRWSLLFLQRLLGITRLIRGNDHSSNILLAIILFREAFSFRMIKEFIRLGIYYRKTFAIRMNKLGKLCHRELLGRNLLISAYLFFLLGFSFIVSIMAQLYSLISV